MLPVKILLVSPDESLANSITPCLSKAGYVVVHNSRGVGIVNIIHLEKPSLIIVDVSLPDINSIAMIRWIRSEDTNDKIPIILMGSNIREEDALLGLEVGADLSLLEAFHPQVFVARIRSLLRRAEALKVR